METIRFASAFRDEETVYDGGCWPFGFVRIRRFYYNEWRSSSSPCKQTQGWWLKLTLLCCLNITVSQLFLLMCSICINYVSQWSICNFATIYRIRGVLFCHNFNCKQGFQDLYLFTIWIYISQYIFISWITRFFSVHFSLGLLPL